MFDMPSDFDWYAHLTLIFSLGSVCLIAVVILLIVELTKKVEDQMRRDDADIDQAINIANSN